jgi:hypothetical protein
VKVKWVGPVSFDSGHANIEGVVMRHLFREGVIKTAMLRPACFSGEGKPVQGCSLPSTRSPGWESGFVLSQFRYVSLVLGDSLEYR